MAKLTSYKKLKLDRFVSGTEQRICKTTTKRVVDNILKGTQKDVFYGEFSNSKLIDKKTHYESSLTGDLINFHDLECDYITNRPDKHKVLGFNRWCKSMVSK